MTSKKTTIIIISVLLTLVILAGIATGIILSKKLKKVKTYSLLSEQNILDYGEPSPTFVLFTNREKEPHTQEEIEQTTLYSMDSSFAQSLRLNSIDKYFDEKYNEENYTAYTYGFKMNNNIAEGLYTNLELEFILKNGKKIRYKVGKLGLSRPKTIPYGKKDALPMQYFDEISLKSASFEIGDDKKALAEDYPYRFNKVIMKYNYANNKPFEILEVSYRVDKDGKDIPAKFIQQDKKIILTFEYEKYEMSSFYLRIKIKQDGVVGIQEVSEGFLTYSMFNLLSKARELIHEPISFN